MQTVGIIAEYNPFHKGHAYQIEEAKKAAKAEENEENGQDDEITIAE